ncbi:MAG: hypothetical protein GOVbin568_32 [Prokaryotic dsDNA virus sp.]|nr:MAG: hypothetical protein GOVbin568_32 [Prokaryotic dsDNA virus sp.]|tara:strand:+ start:7750 stop:8022 length:273 start_codon:yes stop_codon:yes gene_type:complete
MEAKKINTEIAQINSIQVDGNRTFIVFDAYYIHEVKPQLDADADENLDQFIQPAEITMEIPTLDLVQTFNTTWTNHAIGKLKHWLNQITK